MAMVQVLGELLTADADSRVLTYRLLPYGEPGRTNVGRVTASKGVVKLPSKASDLVLNLEHDRKRPVGRGVSIAEDAAGLTASFRIASTSAGNDLLAEADEGLRTGVSVELDDPVIRGGKLVAGALSGAGAVTTPAFPSARLVASDMGEVEGEEPEVPEPDEDGYVTIGGKRYKLAEDEAEGEADDEGGEPEGDEDGTEDDGSEGDGGEDGSMTASRVAKAAPGLRGAGGGGKGKAPLLAADAAPGELFRLLATAGATQDTRLIAELEDITQSGAIGNTEVPQYVGELWSGRAYERRIVPLFNHADLTSFKVNGWRWLVKPTVAAYSGDKADVPSNEVSTEPVTLTAERIAGAHDIDRKYRDFGDEGFWQSYIAAMVESYALVSDGAVMADVLAAATAVEGGEVPDGVAPVWAQIVDGVIAVLGATNTMPNAAVLSSALYRQFLLTPQDGGLEYLNAALGFEEGTVQQGSFRVLPHSALAADQVLVTARDAATVHELGTTPIRVEAENIANGGIDVGVFGYYAVNIHDEGGLALVEPAAEAG